MAYHSMRFGWAAAAIMATMAITAPAYADNTNRTAASTDVGWGNMIVISVVDSFDFAPLAMIKDTRAEQRVASEFPAFKPAPIKQRASRSAVRPTAIAGWRSGRTRHLAIA